MKNNRSRWSEQQLQLSAEREKRTREYLQKHKCYPWLSEDVECSGDCPRSFTSPIKCAPDYFVSCYSKEVPRYCFIEVTGSLTPIKASADLWISKSKVDTATTHSSGGLPTAFYHWIIDVDTGNEVVRSIVSTCDGLDEYIEMCTPISVNNGKDYMYSIPADHPCIQTVEGLTTN